MDKAERARSIGTKKFHVLGSTDAVNTCDCCGKTGLKATWQIEMIDTGERFFYGSVCVTHNTARTRSELNRMQAAYDDERLTAAKAEYSTRPERAAYRAKMEEAHRARLVGREFSEFCRAEYEADKAVCNEIAARHNVRPHSLF